MQVGLLYLSAIYCLACTGPVMTRGTLDMTGHQATAVYCIAIPYHRSLAWGFSALLAWQSSLPGAEMQCCC